MRGVRSATRAGMAALLGLVGAATLLPDAARAQVNGFGKKYRQQEEREKQYVPPSKQTDKIFPLDATWTATSVNGKALGGVERPSFIVDKQYRARGFGGCNTFAATAFPLKEQHIAVGPLALTKRTCDKGLQATEQAFLVALRTAAQWDMVGTQLVIKSQAGELKFERSL